MRNKFLSQGRTALSSSLQGRTQRSFAVITGTGFHQVLDIMKNSPGKLVVVDWFADWCGPCKLMSPLLEEMSEKFPEVAFIKLDVDQLQQDAIDAGIKAMPTFHFMKDGLVVTQVVGADSKKILEAVKIYK